MWGAQTKFGEVVLLLFWLIHTDAVVEPTQMAALSWIPVAVALLMIVGDGLTALNQNQLAPIVQEILNRWVNFHD